MKRPPRSLRSLPPEGAACQWLGGADLIALSAYATHSVSVGLGRAATALRVWARAPRRSLADLIALSAYATHSVSVGLGRAATALRVWARAPRRSLARRH
jgi:hypothetical protein